MQTFIRINEKDNVIVALQDIEAGTTLMIDNKISVTVKEDIPSGHKLSIVDFNEQDLVIKYGYPIGITTTKIPAGSHIHTHNLLTTLGEVLDYTYEPVTSPSFSPLKEKLYHSAIYVADEPNGNHFNESKASIKEYTFQGYIRPDGQVGIRNEIWIIPTVGCVNNVAISIAQNAASLINASIDGVIPFPHPYGCSQMGEDQENSRIIITDLIKHPNAAGVLVLGLGCENSGIEILQSYLGDYDNNRVKFLKISDCEDEISDSLSLIKELINYASTFSRKEIHISRLIVGLKCGGSDGFSGITANPLVGEFSDFLTSSGGTTILTEVPEMFGAETILMNRCINHDIFKKTVSLINDFKEYYKKHNQTIYENPSPGNKAGGISTLEDKSLGCTQKSGTSPVVDVLSYGERVSVPGLNLLSAPGNDLVASTALAAAGAHLILFTTGRGTPFASPVPTLKISSNSILSNRKKNWIDFNAGVLLEGKSMEEVKKDFLTYVLSVASGKKICHEISGYHDMAIFKQGVTL